MIALALRLGVRGGRESTARLATIAVGVAVGVTMLFFAVAGLNALHAQDARWGWLTTSAHNRKPNVDQSRSDPLWWHRTQDDFQGRTIERVDLAATGARAPVPPGIPALPGPGQFYASPALTRLLGDHPAVELGDRFGGRRIGTIGRSALSSPNALVVVIGRRTTELAGRPGTVLVRSIETAPKQHSYSTFQQVALGVGATGLLFPVLIFVAMATRIAAARREQRLAAMRLVGATPRQVATIAAVEAAMAALAGTIAGIALFFMLRPLLARIPITGDSWFTADLSLPPVAVALACVGVPAGAAIAAIGALRRVQIAPLGVTRRVTPPPPKANRLVPLAIGLIVLFVFALAGRPYSRGAAGSYAPTIVIGFVLMMGGLITAGPWLTFACARLLAQRARRPATLLASRRLADNPVAAFRSVSGLILAVFVGSVLVGGTATAVASGASGTGAGKDVGRTAITRQAGAAIPPQTATTIAAQLRSMKGVRAVTPIYRSSNIDPNGFPKGVVACAALSDTPAIGRCVAPTGTAALPLYALDIGHADPSAHWPDSHTKPAELTTSPVAALLVAFDGSGPTLEKVRTTIARSAPTQLTVPKTLNELSAANLRDVTQLRRMADIAILISVLIAGCSLAVAVAGGLIERKRPFSLLRLAGMPLGVLRRVVLLEAAAPLICLAMISGAAGLLTAALLLRAVRGTTMHLPGSDYYLITTAGLAAALAVVGATMPLLRRISDPESARSE